MTTKLTKRNVQKEENKTTTPTPDSPKKNNKTTENKDAELKYGPLPRFKGQKVWTRGVLILGVLLYVWYFSKNGKETSLAKQTEVFEKRGANIDCDRDYLDEVRKFRGCVPKKCGRYVFDKLITATETDKLLRMASRAIALGGSTGGASILDLHSGALSYKDKFINIYSLESHKKVITNIDLTVYKIVRAKIQKAVAETFGLDEKALFLTHPTFFSRLTKLDPVTAHDEYWHPHVDKVTYENFHYTSLLYLNDFGVDFKGGRFKFLDGVEDSLKNITIEPRKGRVSMFTSGAENPHFVERVSDGTRYAITVSFTCDQSKSIKDPVVN